MSEGPSQLLPKPEESIQKVLEEKEGARFMPSEFQVEMPGTYDHDLDRQLHFEEGYTQKILREAVRYVNMPIVMDPFESEEHDKREQWKRQVISRYGDEGYACISSSKLRTNKISNVQQYISMVTRYSRMYDVRTPKVEALIDIHKRFVDAYMDYRKKPLSEKIEVTRDLSKLCLEIIELLSHES